MNLPRQQRGVAIITAMLVVTLATIIATNMFWRSSLDQRRTLAALAGDQGLLFLQGAEAWAGDILRDDLQSSGPDSDHLGETWALEIPPLPVEGGVIAGRLVDLQGRFNLNNLVAEDGRTDPIAQQQFERLLQALELDPGLAGAVADWVDSDADRGFPSGGEDDAYSNADPAYHTPNMAITSVSEIRAVNGIDLETFLILSPHLAALPRGTLLNVNTASAPVLASLSDQIGLSQGESLVEARGGADFPDIQAEFEGVLETEMLDRIDGVSNYFQLRGQVSIGTTQYTMYSVLQRDSSGIVRAVFRSLGSE